MATAGDGTAPFEPAGAGGKLRKKPLRRSIPATPYSRPPTAVKNNNPSMLKKLVDPASRFISAGAHKLFDVFRWSLPPRSLGPPEVNEEPQNVLQNEGDGNAASNSAATGISELEQMLQRKTFTRSEIQRLTSVLHSKTTESPDDSLEKRGDKRVTFHAAISTPMATSGVLEEEIASPAELAKSYMGSRPTNQAPRQDSMLVPRTSITPVAQKTANSLRNLENGFATPRSRGRSAMYTMARSPYFKSPSSQQGIKSDYAHDAALTSLQGHEGRMALKRRSSVLDDDIGSGNSLRRIRQKANLISQREKKELGYTGFQQADDAGQNLLLTDKPEPTVSNYASVPTKATQTATKILQLLDKPSPKENNSVSANELRLDMLHGQALKSLEKVESPKFVSSGHDIQKPIVPELSFQSKDKTEENNVRKSSVSNNRVTFVNGDVRDTLKGKAPVVEFTELPSKVTEVVQIKHAFQMSAPEDSFEMDDDDDDVHDNGTTSAADIVKPPTVLEVSKASELVGYNKPVFNEVSKVPEQIKSNEVKNDTNKGSVSDQGLGFKIPISSSSSPTVTITQSSVFTKSTEQIEKVDPVKVSPFSFAANEVSEFKPNAGSDAKEVVPISVFNSVAQNDAAKVSVSNKDENGNLNGKSESISPAVSVATSADGIFSFGTSSKNLSTPDTTLASNPPTFPSLATFSASASTAASATTTTTTTPSVSPKVFSFGSAASTAPGTSVAGTANTTTSSSSPFAITTFATTTTTESGLLGFSSPATTTSTTNTTAGSGLFGSSSPAATTTTGSGLFGATSAAATSTTATATTGSGLFGISSPAAATSTTTTTGSGLFGASSSAASTTTGSGLFGASSSAAATTTGGGLFGASSSASATTTGSGLFGSSFPAATTGSGLFGFSSEAAVTSTTTATTGSGLFGFSSPAAITSTTTTSTTSGLFGFSSSAAPTSTTTTSTASGLFGFSSPAPATSTTTTGSGLFGASSSTTSTSTTTPGLFGFGSAAAATSTAATTTGSGLFGFSSPAAATSTTTTTPALFGFSSPAAATSTTTTGGVPFAFNSSAAAPSTTTSQSQGSFFNITNGFQANTNPSTTSTLFGSSAPAFGTSTFGTSSSGPTSEAKSGNTTSIFGSTWQQPQTSSAFSSTFTTPSSSVFSFGASTPAPSFMTTGASNSSFGGPSVFGNSTPVFGAVNNNNNNDQMSMEDSMAEDSMQTHSPVSPFGQAPASSPGFMFGSATPTPTPAPAPVSFSFGGQPNQAPPPQNPFQSSSVEFNAGGGSFSLGSGGEKSNRRIVRVMKSKNRKK